MSLGSFDDLGVWFVPAAVLGVPGLLILLVLSIQILGGAMWLPLIRSSLRGVGVGDS
ncbi:MAG: hypothetical protein ACJ77N_13350 [Chloroflexota bacterium]